MAFYKDYALNVGTSEKTVATVPAGKVWTIIGLSVTNTTGNSVNATVRAVDTGGDKIHLGYQVPVPKGSSALICGGDQKHVLNAGDYVEVVMSAADAADVMMSYLSQDQ